MSLGADEFLCHGPDMIDSFFCHNGSSHLNVKDVYRDAEYHVVSLALTLFLVRADACVLDEGLRCHHHSTEWVARSDDTQVLARWAFQLVWCKKPMQDCVIPFSLDFAL